MNIKEFKKNLKAKGKSELTRIIINLVAQIYKLEEENKQLKESLAGGKENEQI